ncbi:MAG: PAS domain-containing protein, partial [Deltaproteobacteria bacterium]|nr:PAS domain-containing protein [Deltaproteobacteria bacterium]
MDDILIKPQHLCNLLDALAVGAILLSPERRVLAVNRSAELMANISAEETLGKPCQDVFMDVLCGGECRFDQAAKTGPVFERVEIEIQDPKHEVRSLTKIIHPLYDAGRMPVGCMEIFQDHSAFTDLIKRLWYEDRRLKIIMENLDTAVMTVDRGGHITFFNTAAEMITGFDRGQILGKSYATLFAEKKDDNLNLLIQTIQDGSPRSIGETWLLTQAGANLPVRANYSAMKNKDGRIVGGLVTLSDLSLKHQLDSAMTDRYSYFDLVGKDPVMQRIF